MPLHKTLLLAAFALGWTASQAQSYSTDEIRETLKRQYPEATKAIYEKTSVFTFYQSSSSKTPVTSKESVEVILSKHGSATTRSNYSTYTNSHSTIRRSTVEQNDDRGRFKKTDSFLQDFPIESGGIFHNDFSVNVITLPSKKGLYRIKYDKLYSDYKFLASVSFTESIPVMNRKLVFEVPSWLELELVERNFDGYGVKKSVEDGNSGVRVYTYEWKQIPDFQDYPFSPSSNHYLPHLLVLYKSMKGAPLLPDVSHLYGWYRSLIEELEEDPSVYSEVTELFAGMPKGVEQIYAVNNWVRDNIRYIAFESGIAGFKPDDGHTVYSNKYGDCKGVANLCKNILLQLGYDARLAWMGTRGDVPYDYSIPSLAVDNHMIAVVLYEGDYIYLDPTETYGDPSSLAFRIQGRPVMIENGDAYLLAEIPEGELGTDVIERTVRVGLVPSERVRVMEITERYLGEPRKNVFGSYSMLNAADRQESLENFLMKNNTGQLTLAESAGLDELANELSFAYTLTTGDGIVDIGGEIYSEIEVTKDLRNIKLSPDRKAPWFFKERYLRKSRIQFDIPDGYSLHYAPESFESKHDLFTIKVDVEQTDKTLIINREIAIAKGEIPLSDAAAWEAALGRLKSYYEEQLIFKQN